MKITVLNPNSSKAVTASIKDCLEPLAKTTLHKITCTELRDAPIGIETDADVALASDLVAAHSRSIQSDVLVVACFSDPGVSEARKHQPVVIGIAEAAYYAALQHGERFGVISLGPASIARHADHIRTLGLQSRLASDRAVQMSVAEANDADAASQKIGEVGRQLIADGADVVILGCAGMGHHRARLQNALGCVVIDPVQAGVAAAITALDLNYRRPE